MTYCWKCEGSGIDPGSLNRIAVVCNICGGKGELKDGPSVDESDDDDTDLFDDDDPDWGLI